MLAAILASKGPYGCIMLLSDKWRLSVFVREKDVLIQSLHILSSDCFIIIVIYRSVVLR